MTTETRTDNEKTFAIGELAKELAVSTRTIRYYEERGLIEPKRTEGGQRIYTRRERGRLRLILRAKQGGFDLAEVKGVLDLYDVLPGEQVEQAQAVKLIEMTERRVTELNQKIDEMTFLRDALLTQLYTLQQMAMMK